MKVTIATLRHSHDRGDDFSVHRDEDTARASLYRDVVTSSWDNVFCLDGTSCGVAGCAGVSRAIGVYSIDEATRIYFAHRSESESHAIVTHDIDLTQPEPPEWATHPRLSTAVDHRGVTGQLTIAYTTADAAFVTTENDSPLTYRGRQFRIAVHLTRGTDGTWAPTDSPSIPQYLTYQGHAPTRDAPPTFAAALMAALVHATTARWTPDIGERARYASAAQNLYHLTRRRDALLTELAAIDTDAGPLWQIVRTHRAPEQP